MLSPGYLEPVPPMVSPFTEGWNHIDEASAGSPPTSATFEAANRAVYVPICVPTVCVAKRVWWANGATTTGGATIEVGIYRDSGYAPGAKFTSGSATQGTASQVQFVDITDVTLFPGLWWLAIMSSSATNTTLFRSSLASAGLDELFRFQEASANPLPATATPAESGNQNIYLFGIDTRPAPAALTASSTTVTASSATFTPSGSWADGDLMVVWASSDSNTPSLPSGWTSLGIPSDTWDDGGNTGTRYGRIAYMVKSGTGSSTFTNADLLVGFAVDASSVLTSNAYGGTLTPNALTAGWLDDLTFYVCEVRAGSITPPTGFTELVEYANAHPWRASVSYQSTVAGSPGVTATPVDEVVGLDPMRMVAYLTVRGA